MRTVKEGDSQRRALWSFAVSTTDEYWGKADYPKNLKTCVTVEGDHKQQEPARKEDDTLYEGIKLWKRVVVRLCGAVLKAVDFSIVADGDDVEVQ